MKLGEQQLTNPINKQIKPTQVYFDTHDQQVSSYLPPPSLNTASMEYLQKQYSEVKPFASPRNPFQTSTNFSTNTKFYARPLNLKASSTSLPTTTVPSPFSSQPDAYSGLSQVQVSLTPQPKPELTMSPDFLQFLYEKFKREYDMTASKQSFYSPSSMDPSTLQATQSLSRLSLETKEFTVRTNERDPNGTKESKLTRKRLDSLPGNILDQSDDEMKPTFPQQLVVSKSTKLEPIKPKRIQARNSSLESLKLKGNAKHEDKLAQRTLRQTGIVKAGNRGREIVKEREERRPRGKAEEATVDNQFVKVDHGQRSKERKRATQPLAESKTTDVPKLPRLPNHKLKQPRKAALSESREQPKKRKYKPYSLKDYKALQKTPLKLGGIGPANVGTEKWHNGVTKKYRISEYMKTLKTEGDRTRSVEALDSSRNP